MLCILFLFLFLFHFLLFYEILESSRLNYLHVVITFREFYYFFYRVFVSIFYCFYLTNFYYYIYSFFVFCITLFYLAFSPCLYLCLLIPLDILDISKWGFYSCYYSSCCGCGYCYYYFIFSRFPVLPGINCLFNNNYCWIGLYSSRHLIYSSGIILGLCCCYCYYSYRKNLLKLSPLFVNSF